MFIQTPTLEEAMADQEFDAPEDDGETNPTGKATTGLVLGIIGMVVWLLPILGLPITIVGLVKSIGGLKSTSRGMATAGVVLCIIGLVLTVVNAAWGAYLGATGQHQLLNQLAK